MSASGVQPAAAAEAVKWRAVRGGAVGRVPVDEPPGTQDPGERTELRLTTEAVRTIPATCALLIVTTITEDGGPTIQ
jgi:hypothetical protein